MECVNIDEDENADKPKQSENVGMHFEQKMFSLQIAIILNQ